VIAGRARPAHRRSRWRARQHRHPRHAHPYQRRRPHVQQLARCSTVMFAG